MQLGNFCNNIISYVTDFNSPQRQLQISANSQMISSQQFDVQLLGSQPTNQYVAQPQQQIDNTQQVIQDQVVQDQQSNIQAPNNQLSLSSAIQQYQPQMNDTQITTTDQQDQTETLDSLQLLAQAVQAQTPPNNNMQQFCTSQYINQWQNTQDVNQQNDQNGIYCIDVPCIRNKKKQDEIDRNALLRELNKDKGRCRDRILKYTLSGGRHLGLVRCNSRYKSFIFVWTFIYS